MSFNIRFSSPIKVLFFGFAILLNLQISAQNYLVSFAGKGASSVVHNVKVENLTSGETLTLHKGEILRLIGIVGISPLEDNKYSLFIYPNPMTSSDAVLRIYPPDPGNALITIYSLTGKIEAQSGYYLDTSPQEYRISGLKNGLHLINVAGKTYHYSGKLICSGNAEGAIRIDPLNSRYTTDVKSPIDEKRSEFIVNMRYTDGDRLKFTGFSDNYSTVTTDIPDEDKTITFKFFPCSDKDNNNYSVVEIASQVWMAENLKTTVYDNGNHIEFSDSRTGIPENQNYGTYSWYENDKPKNEGLYGALYNWYAVSSGNLCPTGWHIPDRQDWLTLEGNLGGANVAGTKIKETGAQYWTTGKNSSTNESGFSALPGGYRVGRDFIGINHYAYLWGSDPKSNIKGSTGWYINSNSEYLVESGIFSVNDGLSVRCIFGESSVTIPEVLTSEINNVTTDKASGGGFIKSFGGAYLTAQGVCWSLLEDPTTDNNKTIDDADDPNFTSSLTGLLPGTTYHVRAYSTNFAGTAYGADKTFTTAASVPVLSTVAPSNITRTTAISGGAIISGGGTSVITSGICWSTSSNPTIAGFHTTNSTGSGSFSGSMTGLTTSTMYYVRAYATNSSGTGYGNPISFTTNPKEIALLTTTPVSSVTSTTAVSGGNITDDGGSLITARGICLSTASNPTIADLKFLSGTGTGSFTSNITGLEPGTVYHIRAYATNSTGTAYGGEFTFTATTVIPTLTTTAVAEITITNATSGGNISSNGGAIITVSGICWGTSHNPTIAGSKTTNGTATGTYISSMADLTPGTIYYVRAYATNSSGIGYGNEVSFTTTTIVTVPVLTTSAVSNITRTGASAGGTISSNGGASVTMSGICWGTSSNPTIAGSHTTDGAIDGSFTGIMTGLSINTVYYVRSYATNSMGTGYGNVISFRTLSLSVASLTTNTVTSITSSTAVSGGNITDDGGATITGRGICWGLKANPTILNFRIAEGTGTGNFTGTMTQLQPEVTYYVRAYATNSQGTAYGTQLSFTTDPNPNTDVTFHSSTDGSILLHSVGNKSIILKTVGADSYIQYSSNNGVSYNTGVKVTGIFSYYNKARILENGNIVLFAVSKIYYSDNNMTSINPCIVLDKDGNSFTLHNPSNPSYPGGYFNFMGGFAENDGVAVMGNYANSSFGASPVYLYYSLDGITWKVFYSFGQNPDYTDDGTAMGGTGGTLLGDPGNPLLARHVHAVNIGGDGNFYACTGDDNQELHFMKCNYSKASDTWAVNDLLSGVTRDWQRMRALGVYEKDGYLYWGSDGPDTFTYHGIQYDSFGIYKCAIGDVNDPSKHILLQPLTDACYSFVNTGNLVFAGLQSYGYIYISYDYGETWSNYAKPAWMDGTVQGIWFNDIYRYFETNEGVKIESSLF